jgi:pimeloyl-ACP methyl ester carboxylesterase
MKKSAQTNVPLKALLFFTSTPANHAQLAAIKQPVLVVNGNDDLIAPTINSYFLYQSLS